jgi:predicted phosphodiesterase
MHPGSVMRMLAIHATARPRDRATARPRDRASAPPPLRAFPDMTAARFAIVSDIHGNLPALEAVWAEIERAAADLVVDLGDIASGPLWPRETVQWLMAREAADPQRWRTIAGNHERQALGANIGRMSPSDAFAARALGAAERAWLGALRPACWILDDVLLCHGTPASDLTYFMETVTPGFGTDGNPGVRAATPRELAQRAAEAAPVISPDGVPSARSGLAASLILCGHSHVPRAMAVAGGPLVVNPGSVGVQAYVDDQPHPHVVEVGSPHARWALVERRAGGGWDVQLRATPYDWRVAAAQAEANGRGDWADALTSGFVGRTLADIAPSAS